jgi:monoterpene epsilon-lactone hydrolase
MTIDYCHDQPLSLSARLTVAGLRLIRRRRKMLWEIESGAFCHSPAPLPASAYQRCRIEEGELNGHRLWVLSPRQSPSQTRVLYLHGGAFTRNIIRYQWDMIARLCELSNATFYVPDYPLAPTADWQRIQAFVQTVWNTLSQQGPLILLGDSAGAGLALRLHQILAEQNHKPAQQLILLSPWLNLAGDDPLSVAIAPTDPMLEPAGVLAAAKAYANDTDLKQAHISPLYGEIKTIKRLSIFAGGNDILYPDGLSLKARARTENIPTDFFEYPHMFHVWMAVSWLPEARKAQQQIAALIRQPDL